MANRLIHESSPYLLQHAHNPVDWYPWGEEAFARARAEDKAVLLSVGYSACHWCHVMEHESFENEAIATLMNDHFVSIKVDREERPDIDSLYMAAVQAMTQRGGWPMTVFMTPDGVPFYGGTYYPPEDRMGMPGFGRVLTAIATTYRDRRGELLASGEQLVAHLRQAHASPDDLGQEVSLDVLQGAAQQLTTMFDSANGGFGTAPKFPQAMVLEFLLRAYRRSHDATPLHMVELTLTRMARGGMYDQLGGGFHRYSVDAHWLVPHFEKMLYDNAQLALVYLHAFQITAKNAYRQVVEETLDYVLREMTAPEGGFYSTQDADSEGHEGIFFVWSPAEVAAVLGADDAAVFNSAYAVGPEGNFEGKTILHIPRDLEAVAAQQQLSPIDLDVILVRSRQQLLAARELRVHPARDEKVLTSWNGLMLQALAEAGAILGRPDYADAAARNAHFLLEHVVDGGLLQHTWKDGRAKVPAYLEDYANLAAGLLSLYEATFDVRWFRDARQLAERLIDQFWEAGEKRFYDTGPAHEQLVTRPRDTFDNATPSGNSVAVETLLRLHQFTGDGRYADIAAAVLRSMQPQMERYALGFGRLLSACDRFLGPSREVAIIGDLTSSEVAAFRQVISSRYAPNTVLAGCAPEDAASAADIPLLAGRSTVAGRPAAYVCAGFVCHQPITNPADLPALVSSPRT